MLHEEANGAGSVRLAVGNREVTRVESTDVVYDGLGDQRVVRA